MDRLSVGDIAKELHLEHLSEQQVMGFAIDSRLIKPGELFFALKGARTDGHCHLQQVAQRGAVAALVDAGYKGESFGLALLFVPNVEEALRTLAVRVLQKRCCKVVAITGSLGKTTTKFFAQKLLSSRYKVFASPHSYNSQLTLPLSILLAKGDEDFLLLEMGMSEPGQIAKLVAIAPPDIALLTTVSLQHADLFPTGLEGIAREKASIFSHKKTQLGLLPYEIAFKEQICSVGSCPKKTFSATQKQADFYFKNSFAYPAFAHNLAAAASLAFALGVPFEEIRRLAEDVKPPSMRFEVIEKEGVIFINDAFNANPDSMIAALQNLPQPASGGRKIAVLSEMNALGQFSDAEHAKVAEVSLHCVDYLLCIGQRCEIMERIWKNRGECCKRFETLETLKQHLFEMIEPGDVVLLKGARSYALDRLLQGETCSSY